MFQSLKNTRENIELPSSFITIAKTAKQYSEDTLYKSRARIFSYVMFISCTLSYFLNMRTGGTIFIAPLILCSVFSLFCIIWLHVKKTYDNIILILVGIFFTLMSVYIVNNDVSTVAHSLLWVTVLPAGLLVALGVKYGSIISACFFVYLILYFTTPLGNIGISKFSLDTQVRLIFVMLTSFGLTFCIEIVRLRTGKALQDAVLHIEQISLTDALTSLGNRRYFDRTLSWTMAHAKRSKKNYSVAIIDIDYFKSVNDTYGHEVGDCVLQFMVQEVSKQMRGSDSLFRWGGEEFTLIMPDTLAHEAQLAAERIRKHIEKTPFILDEKKLFITISLGIYSGNEFHDSKIPLQVADRCLYEAKANGRNRSVISS